MRNTIVIATAFSKSQIQHPNRIFQFNGSWDTDEVEGRRELVDGDEGDDFACRADEEVGWPWLLALALLADFKRHG